MANDNADMPEIETDETPEKRFSRIASARLGKVLDAMRVLRNCAGPGYSYSVEQVDKMDKYIMDERAKLLAAFRGEEIDEKPANLL